MNKPISFQVIHGEDGRPAFVVVPYDEFVERYASAEGLVPNEVVNMVFDLGHTPAKAWRTHLGLTQAQVAAAMGVSQSAYAQLEASQALRKSSREKIAAALRIDAAQLDFQ